MLRKTTDTRRYGIERREFLRYMAAVSAIPTIALRAEGQVTDRPRFSGNPFTLGVASGDPEPNGVVIWTKLAPKPLDGGGMPNEPVTVRWEVATDEAFGDVVRKGTALTDVPDYGATPRKKEVTVPRPQHEPTNAIARQGGEFLLLNQMPKNRPQYCSYRVRSQ